MKAFKHLIFLLIIIGLTPKTYSQSANSAGYNFGRWTLGTNIGGTYITGDVKSNGGIGYGAYMGYALFYKPYRPLRVDLQGRFLATYTTGEGNKLSSTATQNPALNGSYNTYINYSGYDVYYNYRVGATEYALELMFSANRLRERYRLILQGFVGGEFFNYKVSANLLDESGQKYDFTSDYKLDDSYESDAYENQTRQTYIVPTAGYGIGYQIWKHWSILFEHKMTFPLHSNLDGNPFEERTGFYPYDIQHYWGLGITLNFGGGRSNSQSQPQPSAPTSGGVPTNPVTPKPTPVSPPAPKPMVTILDPTNGHASTYNSNYAVIADIKNVDSKDNVTFWLNGRATKIFTYDPQTDRFVSQISLQQGINQIKIQGSNAAGTHFDEATIERKIKDYPPTVNFIDPSGNNKVVEENEYTYVASVTRVNSASQLHVTFNGMATNNYSFDPQRGELSYSAVLTDGQNKLYVVAENNAGKANDEAIVTYKRPVETIGKPPVVSTIYPVGNPYLSGTCSEVVKVQVKGVQSKSQIVVRAGRGTLPETEWAYRAGEVTFTAKANGEALYTVVATNDFGQAQDQVYIKCNKQITICHTNPKGAGQESMVILESEWPTHQAHGDVKGECIALKPTLTLVKPSNTPYTADDCLARVQFKTTNIKSKSEITVTKNGSKFTGWTFMSNLIGWNDPIKENTVYVVTVQNAGGKASKSVQINCEPMITICHKLPEGTGWETIEIKEKEWPLHQAHGDYTGTCLLPPSIQLIVPSTTPYKTTNSSISAEFNIQNIDNASQISVTKQGVAFTSFSYSSGKLTWNDNIQAHTSYTVVATNAAGSKSKTVEFNYEKIPTVKGGGGTITIGGTPIGGSDPKITICHHPPGNPNNTQTLEISTSAWPAHQAHGDEMGECVSSTGGGNNPATGDPKITICHHPPGNPNNTQTLEISASAWPAHQAHGDEMGECLRTDQNPPGRTGPGTISIGNPPGGGTETKITICHHPPGNSGNSQTLQISPSAWPAHQAHGDSMGECEESSGSNNGNGNSNSNGGSNGQGSGSSNAGGNQAGSGDSSNGNSSNQGNTNNGNNQGNSGNSSSGGNNSNGQGGQNNDNGGNSGNNGNGGGKSGGNLNSGKKGGG